MEWTRVVLVAVLLFGAALADADCSREEGDCGESLVRILDDQNFKEVASSAELLLVVFYAPW